MRAPAPRPDATTAAGAPLDRQARAKDWVAALGCATAYAAAGLAARASGFRALSDDDYARVVIAQRFALAPRLDPSGTSWLPMPFWLTGLLMRATAPTLAVARAVAIASAAAAGLLLFTAARRRAPTPYALAGALLPLTMPLVAVLAAATVPELPTGALIAFALVSVGGQSRPAPYAAALAACAASLCRYEAWPAAIYVAAFAVWRASRGMSLPNDVERAPAASQAEDRDRSSRAFRRQKTGRRASAASAGPWLAVASIASAGPLAWVAWNCLAHGDAWSFARRVASYRAGLGSFKDGLASLAMGYPLALLRDGAGALMGLALVLGAGRGATIARHRVALGGVFVLLVGLVAAEARGGAPTHHPERALLACWMVCCCVISAELARLRGRERVALTAVIAVGVGASLAAAHAARDAGFPDRDEALRLGTALTRIVPRGERVLIAPSSYEFFATLASFGRPDDLVAVLPASVDPRVIEADPFSDEPSLRAALARHRARWVVARGGQRAVIDRFAGPPVPVADSWAYRVGGD